MADVNIRIGAKDETGAAVGSAKRGLGELGDEGTAAGEKTATGAERATESTAGLTAGMGKAKLAVAAVGAVAVAAFSKVITSSFDSAREVTKLNVASGLSVERLQELREVGKATGAEIDDIADASRELSLRLTEAAELETGPAVDALNLLGVSLDQLAGLSADERFAFIRDRLSETTNEAHRLFAAEELLGGSSERLAGLIGSDGGRVG